MGDDHLIFPTPQDNPKVPRWVLEMLEEAFPLRDFIGVSDKDELFFLKGVHHTIEFLRARSDKPQ